MNKQYYSLRNTSFLTYIRIDSEDRFRTLELVLKYFNTTIFLLEVDITPKITTQFIDKFKIDYDFLKKKKKNTYLGLNI